MDKIICYSCKNLLDLSDFHKQSRAKWGYRTLCINCRKGEHKKSYKKYVDRIKNDSLEKAKHIFKIYKKLDKKWNREFSLSLDWIHTNIAKGTCFYCGFPSYGIDRINNKVGHTEENSIPCCKECNNARMNNFTHEEFTEIGLAIKVVKQKRLINETARFCPTVSSICERN